MCIQAESFFFCMLICVMLTNLTCHSTTTSFSCISHTSHLSSSRENRTCPSLSITPTWPALKDSTEIQSLEPHLDSLQRVYATNPGLTLTFLYCWFSSLSCQQSWQIASEPASQKLAAVIDVRHQNESLRMVHKRTAACQQQPCTGFGVYSSTAACINVIIQYNETEFLLVQQSSCLSWYFIQFTNNWREYGHSLGI